MRHIILFFLSMTLICMPLFAQEEGAAVGAGGEASAGCGKIMMGSFGEAAPGDAADGSANVESGTGFDGMEGATAESETGYPVDPSAAPTSEVVDGTCDAPAPDGTLTCYQGGVAFECFCCDANNAPAPCNDVDPPCCMQ